MALARDLNQPAPARLRQEMDPSQHMTLAAVAVTECLIRATGVERIPETYN